MNLLHYLPDFPHQYIFPEETPWNDIYIGPHFNDTYVGNRIEAIHASIHSPAVATIAQQIPNSILAVHLNDHMLQQKLHLPENVISIAMVANQDGTPPSLEHFAKHIFSHGYSMVLVSNYELISLQEICSLPQLVWLPGLIYWGETAQQKDTGLPKSFFNTEDRIDLSLWELPIYEKLLKENYVFKKTDQVTRSDILEVSKSTSACIASNPLQAISPVTLNAAVNYNAIYTFDLATKSPLKQDPVVCKQFTGQELPGRGGGHKFAMPNRINALSNVMKMAENQKKTNEAVLQSSNMELLSHFDQIKTQVQSNPHEWIEINGCSESYSHNLIEMLKWLPNLRSESNASVV